MQFGFADLVALGSSYTEWHRVFTVLHGVRKIIFIAISLIVILNNWHIFFGLLTF